MYCARDGDLDRLQGLEYDIIFLDEAAQLSEYQMKAITATLRGVNAFPKRCYYTCNPGGQGHAYIKRVFIDRNFLPTENPDDYTFIQALVDDNKALMEAQPEYLATLEALPRQLREAWRWGRWDVFEGQVFNLIDDPEHYDDHKWTHVINPFPVPEDWIIYRGYDHGYKKPFRSDGMLYPQAAECTV
jgi:phage terminase large subunit